MKLDSRFQEDFLRAVGIENSVALWFQRNGKPAFLYPKKVRPNSSVRSKFRDDGDLMVWHNNQFCRVEVKSSSRAFTGADSFPFDPMFVDECYHIDQVEHRDPLLAYVIVSANERNIAVIKADTKPHWIVITKYDAHQGRQCDFYGISKKRVAFMTMEE